MIKYLFLIGLFISSFFNAQEVLSEKELKYHGVKNDDDFYFHFVAFSLMEMITPDILIDRYQSGHPVYLGYLDTDNTIIPIEYDDKYNLKADMKAKNRISVDYISQGVQEHLKNASEFNRWVLYTTPRFDGMGGYSIRNTAVVAHFNDAVNALFDYNECSRLLRIREYNDDKYYHNPSGTKKYFVDHISGGDYVIVRQCIEKKLGYVIEVALEKWSMFKRREWGNWQK